MKKISTPIKSESMKKILIAMTVVAGLYLFLGTTSAFAANLYWVGNDAAATNVATNWKTTDPLACGGGDASAAPTTTDVAIFDADCDNGAAITGSFSVAGVNMNTGYTGTVTQNAVALTIGASGWTQAAGTFTGGSGNITIQTGGDMNLTGGTFNSTSGTLLETDNWTVNGGAFSAGTGTVNFTAVADNAATITGSITFNNLKFGSGDTVNGYRTITIASGTTLTVPTTGTLTLNGDNGDVSPARRVLNGPGSINAKGNIVMTGVGFQGSAVILIDDTATQTITAENDTDTQLPAVTINKTGGSLTIGASSTTSTIAITDNFTYTAGTVDYTTYSSKVNFTAAADQTATLTGSVTFNNLNFGSSYTADVYVTITIASGTTLTVPTTGTLTLNGDNGDVSPARRVLNGPGSINAKGNIVMTGVGFQGSAVILIDDTATQTITAENDTDTQLPAVTINKTGGSLTIGASSTTSTIAITDNFTYTAGTVDYTTYSSKVNFTAAADQTATLTGSVTFNNLNFGSSYTADVYVTITIASGTTLTVPSGSTLTLAGSNTDALGARRVLNGPGAITAQGDITLTGVGFNGNALITVNGTGSQALAGEADLNTQLPGITINKSSGTLTITNTVVITDDFTYTTGTLSPGSSTVAFSGAGDSSATLTGSVTLANISFFDGDTSAASRTITVASGTTITGTGSLTFTNTGTDAAAADRVLNGPGTVVAQGDFSNISTPGISGNVPITLSGSNNQALTSSAGSIPSGTFTINKTSGTVTLGANFSVNSSGQDLLLSSGTLAMSSYSLTVNDTLSIGGTLTQSTANVSAGTYTVSQGGTWTNASTGDITVGSGGVTNNGTMNLGVETSCGGSDSIAITSSSGGTARTWTGSGTFNLYDITVTDQNETPKRGRVIAWSSTNSSNSNWTFNTNCPGNPVAYYRFDDGTGTTAQDSSTNNLDGTLNNTPTWKTEDFCIAGKCLYFDGTNNENVSKADDAKLDFAAASNFTISAWAKRDGASSANTVILGKASANIGSTYQGYKLYMDTSGDFCFDTQDGTLAVDSACTSAVEFDDDKWHLVQGVKTGTTKIELFIDGNLRASDASIASTGSLANSGTFYTGIDSDGLAIEWLGYLDEVKVYTYARTAAQIKTDFLKGATSKGSGSVLGGRTLGNNDALSNGLVGYWKMDESSWTVDCSTASVTDSSGVGNNGKSCPNSTGPSGGAAGKFGNGGSFDGSNDYVTISHNSALTPSNFTISVWVNPTTVSTDFLVNKMDYNGSVTSGYSFWVDSNAKMTLRLGNGLNQWRDATDTGASVTTTSWQHLVVAWDGTNAKFYRNNTAGGTVTPSNSGAMTNSSGALDIGRMWTSFDGGANYAAGTIDEVRIYNRVFSAKEISDLYNWAPGPTGYWNFEEGTGTSANDLSTNANTGTITNAVWSNGKYGAGLKFDGAGDYASRADDSDFDFAATNNFTVGAWVKHNGAIATNPDYILTKGDATNGGYQLYMDSSGNLCFGVDDDGNPWGPDDSACSSGTNYSTDGKWHHLAGVKTGTTKIELFVNGVLAGSDASILATGTLANTGALYIGIDTDGSSNSWDGWIDEPKIYNYARTPKQIVEDMLGGRSLGGGPNASNAVGYYKFDEGALNKCSGGTNDFCDSTSNANDLAFSTTTGGFTDSGKFGKALHGTGAVWASRSDDADFDFAATDDFAISLWYKSDSANNPGAVEYLFNKANATTAGYAVYANTSGNLCFGIDDDTTWGPDVGSCTSTDVYDNTWHHLVGVRNTVADQTLIYIDGVLKDSDTDPTTATLANSLLLYVGNRDGTDNGDEFNGDLDEIKVYRYALTGDEVKTEYNKGQSMVLGSLSDTSGLTGGSVASNSASAEYCIPGDSTSCTAPKGEYKFEKGDCTDTSGNGNSGTVNNSPTQVRGKVGKALAFTSAGGAYCFLGASSNFITVSEGTLSGWIYPTSTANTSSLVNYGDPLIGNAGGYFGIVRVNFSGSCAGGETGDKIYVYNFDGGSDCFGITYNTNEWVHITWVHSGGTLYMYKNGALQGSVASGDTAAAGMTGNTSISRGTGGTFLNGYTDNILLYNYARSAAQIVWDYNKGKPVGHWKMDECQGTSVGDSSGNGNTGTITIGGTGTQTTGGTCTAPTDGTGAWYNGRTGKRNYSLSLDGTDDVVTVTNANPIDFDVGLKNGVSFSAWIYADSDGEGDLGQVFWKGTNTYLRTSGQSGSNLNIDASLDLATTDATKSLTAPITTGAWNHIVVTYSDDSDDEITIYVNGVNKGSSTDGSGAPASTDTNNLLIGGTTTANFDGQIDDFRVYNYELTGGQVKTLYNANSAVYFGPSSGNP